MSVVRKKKKSVNAVSIYINASFNNTLISICDIVGNVLLWSSSGCHGLKGPKKGTAYASKLVARGACKKFNDLYKLTTSSVKIFAEIFIKGPGIGSESAIRELSTLFVVTKLSNITAIPHNGCRPKKMRRV